MDEEGMKLARAAFYCNRSAMSTLTTTMKTQNIDLMAADQPTPIVILRLAQAVGVIKCGEGL